MFVKKEGKKIFSKCFCEAMLEGDHLDIMSMIQYVDPVNLKDDYERTLLHISCAFGNKEITHYLIDSGCDVNAQDSLGCSPIILAIHFNHFDIIKLLMRAKADLFLLNSRQMSAFAFVSLFRKRKPTAFHIIYTKIMEDRKVEEHATYARNINHHHSIEEELSFNLEEKGIPVKHLLNVHQLYFNYPEAIEINLMYKEDPIQADYNGNTAIHALATLKSDNYELLQQLLDNGADINVSNDCGVTPLHVACSFGNVHFAKTLLWKHANVNAKDKYGRTPLYAALLCNFEYFASRQNRLLLLKWYKMQNEFSPPGPFQFDDEIKECNIKYVTCKAQKLMWLLFEHKGVIDKFLVTKCSSMDVVLLEHHHFILHHIARIAQTSSIPDYCQEAIDKLSCCQSYYKLCCEELQAMKSKVIHNDIKFFDLLTENTNRIASYVRDKKFNESFRNTNIDEMYPFYCTCLENRYHSGIERYNFLKKANAVMDYVMPFLDSNNLVIRKIVSYLNEDDLRNIDYPSDKSYDTESDKDSVQLNNLEIKDSDKSIDDDDLSPPETKKRYIQL